MTTRPGRLSKPVRQGKRPKSRWRWLTRPLIALVVLALVWVTLGYFVVGRPSVDKPHHVDAIVVLGPPEEAGALQKALTLVKQGYSKNLLISTNYNAHGICKTTVPDVNVTCFRYYPFTTRGEAEYVGQAAARNNWTSVMVLTGTYHVARSRLLMDRCFHGKVLMIGADDISWPMWRYQFFYETGGWAKALWHRSC